MYLVHCMRFISFPINIINLLLNETLNNKIEIIFNSTNSSVTDLQISVFETTKTFLNCSDFAAIVMYIIL